MDGYCLKQTNIGKLEVYLVNKLQKEEKSSSIYYMVMEIHSPIKTQGAVYLYPKNLAPLKNPIHSHEIAEFRLNHVEARFSIASLVVMLQEVFPVIHEVVIHFAPKL